jgi:transcription elongation factor Elf1
MSFFHKPKLSTEVLKSLERFEAVVRSRPELVTPARTLTDIVVAIFDESKSERSLMPPTIRELQAAWSQGHPVFRLFPPTLEKPILEHRAREILRILARHGAEAKRLRHLLSSRQVDLMDWCSRWVAGDRQTILNAARHEGLSELVVSTTLRLTLLPSLSRLGAGLPAPTDWETANCPFCGSSALLAELRGIDRVRSLRCGLCAGDWQTSRLGCPTCGESRPLFLNWVALKGESDRFRLLKCEACDSRLKMISTLFPLSPSGLVAAELELIHLDYLD